MNSRLPNFVIIGAPRSGTTYLKTVLEQHPEIYMASAGAYTGDIHFFNQRHHAKNYEKGLGWYRSYFEGITSQKAIGEKSVSYLNGIKTPELIRDVLGEDVKLVACLRNPMQRAYSSYWFQIEDIPRNINFIKACALEKSGQLNLQTPLINPGFYYQHVTNYLKCFRPEQLHLIVFDFLKHNPLAEIRKLFGFLDVDQAFVPCDYETKVNQAAGKSGSVYQVKKIWGFVKKNCPNVYESLKKLPVAKGVRQWIGRSSEEMATKKKYPKMSDTEYRFLSKLYYESNRKTGQFVGTDLISLWHQNTG